jgi:hypothetical protein
MLVFAIRPLFALAYAAGMWIGVRLIENQPGAWKLLTAYMWMQVPVVQSDTITCYFSSLVSFSWLYEGGLTFRYVYGPGAGGSSHCCARSRLLELESTRSLLALVLLGVMGALVGSGVWRQARRQVEWEAVDGTVCGARMLIDWEFDSAWIE